jgi:hypothetical protein
MIKVTRGTCIWRLSGALQRCPQVQDMLAFISKRNRPKQPFPAAHLNWEACSASFPIGFKKIRGRLYSDQLRIYFVFLSALCSNTENTRDWRSVQLCSEADSGTAKFS